MKSNKRLLIGFLFISIFLGTNGFFFAQEQEEKEGLGYQLAVSLSMSPVLESKPDDGTGKNHFEAIKGIYIPDGDFVNLVLGLQAMIYLNDNNQLAIGSSLSSQRAFLGPATQTSSNIIKIASGREWSFTGLTLLWV